MEEFPSSNMEIHREHGGRMFLYFAETRACRDSRCDFEARYILTKACKGAGFLARSLNINAFWKSNFLVFVLLRFPLVAMVAFVWQMKKRPILAQSAIETRRKRKLAQHLKTRQARFSFAACVNPILELRQARQAETPRLKGAEALLNFVCFTSV